MTTGTEICTGYGPLAIGDKMTSLIFTGRTNVSTSSESHVRQVIEGEKAAEKQIRDYFNNKFGENSTTSFICQQAASIPMTIVATAAETSASVRDFVSNTVNDAKQGAKKIWNYITK